jgi:hypothetical protein
MMAFLASGGRQCRAQLRKGTEFNAKMLLVNTTTHP